MWLPSCWWVKSKSGNGRGEEGVDRGMGWIGSRRGVGWGGRGGRTGELNELIRASTITTNGSERYTAHLLYFLQMLILFTQMFLCQFQFLNFYFMKIDEDEDEDEEITCHHRIVFWQVEFNICPLATLSALRHFFKLFYLWKIELKHRNYISFIGKDSLVIYWLNLIEKPRQVFDKKKWKDSALVRSRLVTRDLAGTRTSGRESGQNLLTEWDLCVSFQRKQSISIYALCMFEPICPMKKFTSRLLLILLPVEISSCKYLIIIPSVPLTKAKNQIYLG